MDKKQHNKMDSRCPIKLKELPDRYCPLAVQRLKALRHAGRELTEEEEALLPGCPWAVNHQLANYCFFKLVQDWMPDKGVSDMEVAHLCSVSTDTVKSVSRSSIEKIRESKEFKEISDIHDGENIVEEIVSDVEHVIS